MNSQERHTIQVQLSKRQKHAKEKTLAETLAYICAFLNTNGGAVVLRFNEDESKPDISNECTFKQKRLQFVRTIEQSLISSIGSQMVSSNIDFKPVQNCIVCMVKKCNSLITINYNLYLPSETQANSVSTLERIEDTILNRQLVPQRVVISSHHKLFIENENCCLTESKMVQLKHLKAGPSKRTTLADRMTGNGNKFSCYVSAFANYNGGHIYYGITDDGVVKGEFIPKEKDKEEIAKSVEKAINRMMWPEQPKRGIHWEIFFVPVKNENSDPIPSTFVIVIYVAASLGGVFTGEPESYELVEGVPKKISFVAWKKRMLAEHENLIDQSSLVGVVPCQVSRIQWSSDDLKKKCISVNDDLMRLINNGKWVEFKRKAKNIQQENPGPELELMVLSKMVIANSRQSCFKKARDNLSDFYEILRTIDDTPFFNALALYLEIVLKRNQMSFEGIGELLVDALAKAEMIETGFLTAAIHLIVATVSSFHDQESGIIQDKYSKTAIEHLQGIEKKNSVTQDLEQKAYVTLAFSNLKCVLSKSGLVLEKECTEKSFNEAKCALTALDKSALQSPPSRYREVQTKMAKSVLYHRQVQFEHDVTVKKNFLEAALNCASDATELAKKFVFREMICWSETLIRECVAELVCTQFNSRSQH